MVINLIEYRQSKRDERQARRDRSEHATTCYHSINGTGPAGKELQSCMHANLTSEPDNWLNFYYYRALFNKELE